MDVARIVVLYDPSVIYGLGTLKRLMSEIRGLGIQPWPHPPPLYPELLKPDRWLLWSRYWQRHVNDVSDWEFLFKPWYGSDVDPKTLWGNIGYLQSCHSVQTTTEYIGNSYSLLVIPAGSEWRRTHQFLDCLFDDKQTRLMVNVNVGSVPERWVDQIPSLRYLEYPDSTRLIADELKRLGIGSDTTNIGFTPRSNLTSEDPFTDVWELPAPASHSGEHTTQAPKVPVIEPDEHRGNESPWEEGSLDKTFGGSGVSPGSVTGAHDPFIDHCEHTGVSEGSQVTEEVYLGVTTPQSIYPKSSFVARFGAYINEYREELMGVLEREAPTANKRLDLERCRWRQGTEVSVHLSADGAMVSNPIQCFCWEGSFTILRFDVQVDAGWRQPVLNLRFDIAIAGLIIARLRPEVSVAPKPIGEEFTLPSTVTEATTPRSAFASYAVKDQKAVLNRIRSVQIATGMDVFLDCASLQPGDQWKAVLEKEILSRDCFWLFWSRHAMDSEWVEWEWRTALMKKSLDAIQPHPLEPMDQAPPPPELSDLQFGALYESYLATLA